MRPAGAGRPASRRRDDTGSSAARDSAVNFLMNVLRPTVESTGYVLEDVTVSSAGRRSLVRVSVDTDGPGPGIDLDGIAAVSHAVSEALDRELGDLGGGPSSRTAAPGLTGPYVLEVSSPGVDRPLTEPRHWRRAVGRLVEVPADGVPVTGRVRTVADSGVTLDVGGAVHEFGWPQLGRGRVQVEFSRPGGGNDKGAATGVDGQEDPA